MLTALMGRETATGGRETYKGCMGDEAGIEIKVVHGSKHLRIVTIRH